MHGIAGKTLAQLRNCLSDAKATKRLECALVQRLDERQLRQLHLLVESLSHRSQLDESAASEDEGVLPKRRDGVHSKVTDARKTAGHALRKQNHGKCIDIWPRGTASHDCASSDTANDRVSRVAIELEECSDASMDHDVTDRTTLDHDTAKYDGSKYRRLNNHNAGSEDNEIGDVEIGSTGGADVVVVGDITAAGAECSDAELEDAELFGIDSDAAGLERIGFDAAEIYDAEIQGAEICDAQMNDAESDDTTPDDTTPDDTTLDDTTLDDTTLDDTALDDNALNDTDHGEVESSDIRVEHARLEDTGLALHASDRFASDQTPEIHDDLDAVVCETVGHVGADCDAVQSDGDTLAHAEADQCAIEEISIGDLGVQGLENNSVEHGEIRQVSSSTDQDQDRTPLMLAPALEGVYTQWRQDPTTLFASLPGGIPKTIAAHYAFAIRSQRAHIVVKVLQRFVYTTYCDVLRRWSPMETADPHVVDFLVQSCMQSGDSDYQVIHKNILSWASRGRKLRILTKALGGDGCLFVLPFERESLYSHASNDELEKIAAALQHRGIRELVKELGADGVAVQVQTLFMKPFETPRQLRSGQHMFALPKSPGRIEDESSSPASVPSLLAGTELTARVQDISESLSREGYAHKGDSSCSGNDISESYQDESCASSLMVLVAFGRDVPMELFDRAKTWQSRWHIDGSIHQVQAPSSAACIDFSCLDDDIIDSDSAQQCSGDANRCYIGYHNGLLSVRPDLLSALLPTLVDRFWENEALTLLVHAFPRDKWWEPELRRLSATLGPLLLSLTQRLAPCYVKEEIKMEVIDCLLVHATLKTSQERSTAVDLAETILRSAESTADPQYQIMMARCVLERSRICRIRGEYAQSDALLASYTMSASYHMSEQPVGGLLNSVFGLLNLSQMENHIQQNKIQQAVRASSMWESSQGSSVAETRAFLLRSIALAKVARAGCRYMDAEGLLSRFLECYTTNDASREQAVFLHIDTLCDLLDFDQAQQTLQSFQATDPPFLKKRKTRARILCSEADICMGLGQYQRAWRALCECQRLFNRPSKDMGEQLLHVRALMASARLAHFKDDHAGALRCLLLALQYARRYRSFQPEGCTVGTILMCMAFECTYLGCTSEQHLLYTAAKRLLCDQGDVWIPVITKWRDIARHHLSNQIETRSDQSAVPRPPYQCRTLYMFEKLLAAVRNYYEVTCQEMTFDNNGILLALDGTEHRNDLCDKFDSLCFRATMLIADASVDERNSTLNEALALLPSIIESQHPRTLTCFFEVLLHLTRSGLPEVVLEFQRYIAVLSERIISLPSPWRKICQLLGQLDAEVLTSAMERAWSCVTETVSTILGRSNRLAISIHLDYMKRVVVDLVEEENFLRGLLTALKGRLLPSTPRVMLNLAHNLLRQARYTEASETAVSVSGVLTSDAKYADRVVERIECLKILAHSCFQQNAFLDADRLILDAIRLIEENWGQDHAWWKEFMVVLEGWRRSWVSRDDVITYN
ncbi:Hypothetical protein D9617_53g017750 [Elsinoe fawcettii]|nr:Hypothetical protein D9617_53g017750 [Elsinoe fawcettii]